VSERDAAAYLLLLAGDTPSACGKNLVGRVLQDAIGALDADVDIEGVARDDEDRRAVLRGDTAGEPGSIRRIETRRTPLAKPLRRPRVLPEQSAARCGSG
jgi:hypothetical protein